MTHRVLQIVASLRRCGRTAQLAAVTTGLIERGFVVHVVALRGGELADELTTAGAKVHVLPRRHRVDPLVVIRLRALAAKLRPSVAHAWDPDATIFARAARLHPLVTTIDQLAAEPGGWFESLVPGEVDCHLAATNQIADRLQSDGIEAERVVVVPRVVAPPTDEPMTKAEAFAELSLPSQARAIAVVANLTPSKNVKELIWHADLVRVLNDDLRVVIFGEGPIRPALERFARMASDLEHVRFAGHRSDLRRLLLSFEMLWHAGSEAAPPAAVLEAMATGLPVIAANTPGSQQAIVHGETGYLVRPTGRAERARYTEQLLSDEPLRRSLGNKAQQRAASDYRVDGGVNRLIEAYESVQPEAATASRQNLAPST